jgi:hypothetical protein
MVPPPKPPFSASVFAVPRLTPPTLALTEFDQP